MKLSQLEQELQRARQQVCPDDSLMFAFSFFSNYMGISNSIFTKSLYFWKGIFISSSGDQSQSLSGNGMFSL